MKDLHHNIISTKHSVKDALTILNELGENLTLFVVDNAQQLKGTLTDGDIRRSLIKETKLHDTVTSCMNTNFTFLVEGEYDLEKLRSLKSSDKDLVPILNSQGQLLDIFNIKQQYALLPLDAIIMAGGRGERLAPLTDHTPKPMLKVGGLPIIERNINRLIAFGIKNIHLSVRYLGAQLHAYFGNGSQKQIEIHYVEEDRPLGTLGAASKITDLRHEHVLIMNSDLLTNIDYELMYESHIKTKSAITIATFPHQVSVPYAVLETDQDRVYALREKPTYSYNSNAGIYIVKKDLLKEIPQDTPYNATDLIETAIQKELKVTHFSIVGYWLDIGKHEDFQKAQRDVERIKF